MGLTKKGITGYNVKTKTKDVLMEDVEMHVSKTKNSYRFIAKGVSTSSDETKMSAIIGKQDAFQAVANGFCEPVDWPDDLLEEYDKWSESEDE